MNRLAGKVVLVSGGGADGPPKAGETLAIGNGRAVSILCAREGASVMVADRSLKLAEETVGAIVVGEGGRAAAIAADVSDEEACSGAVAASVAKFGALHLLVNNVGIVADNEQLDAGASEFDRVMNVNLRGHFLMMKYAVPEMVKAGGGAIVNVSSMAAVRGASIAYGPSKAALIALSRGVALQYARQGIRVNTVLPGLIDSTIARRRMGDREAKFAPLIPMGRQGTSWEIANVVLFLLSDEASYVTATELVVDGGIIAQLPGFQSA